MHGLQLPCLALRVLGFVLAIWSLSNPLSDAAERVDADLLVLQLRGLPAEVYLGPMSHLCNPAPAPCLPPPVPPAEARRWRIYEQLYMLRSGGVPALARGLGSTDVRMRRNAALALDVVGDGLWNSPRVRSKIDISAALPALIVALQDPDFRVRGLAAQAVRNLGPSATPAVPDLVRMLASEDEGLRNSACVGLRGIGPSATDALPALERAASDPSYDVRQFAQLAIASIEGRLSVTMKRN